MNPEHYDFTLGINLTPEEQDLSVLFSGEGRPHPGHTVGPSVHDFYLIHTVLEGGGLFQSDTFSAECRAGDTFVIIPGSLFSYKADLETPWHYAWVALQGIGVLDLLRAVGITREQPFMHSDNVAELHSLYERIRHAFKQSAYPRLESLEASGWVRLLLHEFGRDNLSALPPHPSEMPEMIDRQIDQAIRWITLQYHQQISIDHIASSLGYHRVHLSKAFKQRTGLSPKQFLLKIRMDKARELLGSPLTIEQVASSVGFNDALYFSKQFRKHSGMPPSEYRAGLRGGY
ncbi:AraC family transcriptional regulator [Paenibacillus tritici]|uniref:AraC family transcriptional regulator n=1 Tax=Paenibacillus tritici TaxID=1873425 RepID=A0ABX2DJ22_9BACL|nr:AraC family transcriptional regulator [Paenibacillus tritici]NQX44312.1 AraC family transcriptional regulator [Paenibacillus tritici]QUL57921.1 AraC family transcriptional regulator [Paenibacillus tritici]